MIRRYLPVCILLSARFLAAAPGLTLAPLDPGLSGLTVLLPNDPGFQGAVESIAAASHRTIYAPALPYSFVLRNDSAKPIIELTIATSTDGHINGGFSEATNSPKDTPLLAPGQQRVFLAMGGGGTLAGSSINSGVQRSVSLMAAATTVVVSVDAVLFADGVFAGPDVTAQLPRAQARLTANATVAGAILGYQSGYKTGDTAPLEQYLSGLSHSTGLSSDYQRELRMVGTMYAGTLRRHGSDEMFQLASDIAQGTAGFVIHR